MATAVLVNLNLNGNQILGLRLEVLAADPSGGGLYEGRIWFNSTDDLVKFYDGTDIVPWGTGGTGVATLTVDDITLEDVGTATDPSIRVKALGISTAHLADTISLTKFTAPTADFGFGGFKLTSLGDPTTGTDAANKQYVDAVAAGLAPKDAVRAATTAAGTLASSFENGDSVDSVTLATGDRILIKNQAAPAENGIYTVNASGAPTRATDADSSADLVGAAVFVSEGTTNGNTLWVMTTDAPITVNTTGLVWAQFGGPGAFTAGTGLTLTGSQFSLTVPVTVALGGTGATTAAGAKTNLGFMTRFAADVGNGSSTSIGVTHNLGTLDVHVAVYENSSGAEVLCDIVRTNTNTVTLGFTVAPTSNQFRCVVIG